MPAKKTPAKKAVKKTALKTSIKTSTKVDLTDKQKTIEMFAQKKGDTGSPEVQVALLTQKIDRLTKHLEQNKKDDHSRRGLLKVIAKRRRILNYLQRLGPKRYKILLDKVGLKK